jgi:CheY-like chemotaxis protein
MENGGTLTIETGNASLDDNYVSLHAGTVPGDHVRVSITDTGHGMDAATQARIFEPFFTTKEIGRGTGLGLSTIYGIIKQSNGNIWVQSEPGRGTTFDVFLPRSPAALTRVRRLTETTPTCQKDQSILVVEDDPNVCKLVKSMLAASGYSILTASSASEALDICHRDESIDLLLCDMVLPETDGPTVAQQVLALRPGVPVLFMSGYPDHAVFRESSFESNAPFLQKPFNRQDLIQKIKSLLAPEP